MNTASTPPTLAFIGGGNMASAIAGGLIQHGVSPAQLIVVEPFEATRAALKAKLGIDAQPEADERLQAADLVIWAVKPQVFAEAAQPVAAWTKNALHLSVAAGIPTDAIARWLGTERIVRAMPNTPALVGLGMTGLFARDAVSADERALVERVLAKGDLWTCRAGGGARARRGDLGKPSGQQLVVHRQSHLGRGSHLSSGV